MVGQIEINSLDCILESIYIILNNKKKKKSNKKVAHCKKDTTVYIVPFRPAFGEAKKTEENYFHEHKHKCMSMRRHRASLFVEQSVFLPGRPKKKKKNLHQIKPMTFCLPFTHEKWSSLRLTS